MNTGLLLTIIAAVSFVILIYMRVGIFSKKVKKLID